MLRMLRKIVLGPLVEKIDTGTPELMPLDFALSDHHLHVEIPKRFSKGMPPTKLVPALDLNSPKSFGGSRKTALLKVMWDFPRPHFWQPDYGSATMTLWVHMNPSPERYDVFSRNQFIAAIQHDLKDEYDAYNQQTWEEGLAAGRLSIDVGDDLISFGRNTDERFSEHEFNGNRWLSHFIIGAETHTYYCTPVDIAHYVSFDFEFMPSHGVYAAELPGMLEDFMNQIMATTHLGSSRTMRQEFEADTGVTIDAPTNEKGVLGQ